MALYLFKVAFDGPLCYPLGICNRPHPGGYNVSCNSLGSWMRESNRSSVIERHKSLELPRVGRRAPRKRYGLTRTPSVQCVVLRAKARRYGPMDLGADASAFVVEVVHGSSTNSVVPRSPVRVILTNGGSLSSVWWTG